MASLIICITWMGGQCVTPTSLPIQWMGQQTSGRCGGVPLPWPYFFPYLAKPLFYSFVFNREKLPSGSFAEIHFHQIEIHFHHHSGGFAFLFARPQNEPRNICLLMSKQDHVAFVFPEAQNINLLSGALLKCFGRGLCSLD